MEDTSKCRSCNSVISGNYCSECGQKVIHERFTVSSFVQTLLAAFNLEKGFLFTVKELFIHPGNAVNDYLSGKTKPYVNPLTYLLVIGGVYSFLLLKLNIFDAGMEAIGTPSPTTDEAMALQNKWFTFYKNIINFIPLLLIPFISLASKWVYKSRQLYYGEFLIINSFLFVQILVLIVVLAPIVLIAPPIAEVFPFITLFIIIAYLSYSLKSIFRESFFRSLVKAILSLLLGYLLFVIFFVLIISIIAVVALN